MKLVEQHIVTRSDPRWVQIDTAAWMSKNIYNAATYRIRQAYFSNSPYLNYPTIEKQFKQRHLLPDQQLPMKVVQQTLRQVDHDWQAYFAALAEWRKHPHKFQAKPRMPGYKNTAKGRNMLVYTAQAISKPRLAKGFIRLSGLDFEIKTQQQNVDQVRIVPRRSHYIIEVVYTVTPREEALNPNHILALDLGIDNLAALASNQPGFVPLLVNGKPLKSINHLYNRELARLKSALPKEHATSKRIQQMTFKRNQRIDHYLHTASRRIIDLMRIQGMGTLVIGKNAGWKQAVNLGKRTNQNFVQIPHARFIEMLTYKAALVGIKVIVIEESYTSKCSFLDEEAIGKQQPYAGKRIKRGLFKAGDGRKIHADVNGAYNILRKAIPDAFASEGIGGAVVHPLRVTPA